MTRSPTSRTFPGLALPARAVGAFAPAVRTAPRPFVQDLDALPFPAWDLVDIPKYRAAWTGAHGRLSWNVVTTRGCPYRCNWCAKPLYGVRYAQRSPGNVADEMARLKQTVGPGHVWFADDIFGLSHRWIERFADELAARDAVIPFTMQSRVDLMTPSAVEALRRAGAEEVWMGVESGAQKILDAMDKGTTIVQVREATRLLKAAGIRASWFLQLGYPGEEWPEILATRDLDPRGAARRRRRLGRLPAPRDCSSTSAFAASSGTRRTGTTATSWRCSSKGPTPDPSTGTSATCSTTRLSPRAPKGSRARRDAAGSTSGGGRRRPSRSRQGPLRAPRRFPFPTPDAGLP